MHPNEWRFIFGLTGVKGEVMDQKTQDELKALMDTVQGQYQQLVDNRAFDRENLIGPEWFKDLVLGVSE